MSGFVSAAGNILAGNLNTAGNVTASGTIRSGNISVTGNVIINNQSAVVSNINRRIWVSNTAPTGSQGSIGDIWYQF